MKTMLSALLAGLAMTGMAVTAAADCYPDTVYPGGTVEVSGFVDSNGEECDLEWVAEDYGVSASFRKGGSYVESVYIDDDTNYVNIKIKSDIIVSSEKEIVGTIKLRARDTGSGRDRERNRETYTCKIESGDLTLNARSSEYLVYCGENEFSLPHDYKEKMVKFRTDDDVNCNGGKLFCEFTNDDDEIIAYYQVRIAGQQPMYLGHNQEDRVEYMRKYEYADMRFISWESFPNFEIYGVLGIVMEPNEYLYEIMDDGNLVAVDAAYNRYRGTYDFKTMSLGRYLISSRKLAGVPTAAAYTATASAAAVSLFPEPEEAPELAVPVSSADYFDEPEEILRNPAFLEADASAGTEPESSDAVEKDSGGPEEIAPEVPADSNPDTPEAEAPSPAAGEPVPDTVPAESTVFSEPFAEQPEPVPQKSSVLLFTGAGAAVLAVCAAVLHLRPVHYDTWEEE